MHESIDRGDKMAFSTIDLIRTSYFTKFLARCHWSSLLRHVSVRLSPIQHNLFKREPRSYTCSIGINACS